MNPKTRKFRVLSLAASLIILALLCICKIYYSSKPQPKKILHANETATLTGVDFPEPFYGPPNFGENPETDAKLTAHILRLNHPVEYVTEYGKTLQIQEVQLIDFGKPTNREITIEGELFDARTGCDVRQVQIMRKRGFLESLWDKIH